MLYMNSNNRGDQSVIVIIVVISVCVSMLLGSSVASGVYAYEQAESPSPSPSGDNTIESPSPSPSGGDNTIESPSPSPVSCEIDWSEASWAPCTADKCPDDKIDYKYRRATVKQAAKHGGRECPALTEYELVESTDSVSSPSAAADASSPSAAADASSPSAAATYPSPIPINHLYYMLPMGEQCIEEHIPSDSMDCQRAYEELKNNEVVSRYGPTEHTDPNMPCSIKYIDGTPNIVLYISGTRYNQEESSNINYAPICKYSSS